MAYGLTTNGFVRKTFENILADLINLGQTAFNSDFASNQSSPEYIELVNRAESLADIWEQLENVYFSFFPLTATGVSLDNAYSVVGVYRIKGRKSIVRNVELTNNSNNPITVPAGSRVMQSTSNIEWVLMSDVNINANDTAMGIFECSIEGQIYAPIGSIDTILTFINGWEVVDNTQDVLLADLGRLIESDEELKIRGEATKRQIGTASCIAIANKIKQEVSGVTYANFLENRTDSVDINGLPSHSFQMFVLGGSDSDIAEKINQYRPAGINTFGSVTENVTDEFGNITDISFSRLTQRDIYFRIDITTNSNWISGSESDIENLIIDFVNNAEFNETLYTWKYYTLLDNVVGVDSLTIYQGLVSNPNTTANIAPVVNEKNYTVSANFIFNIA
jgi:uncharacterized phage protein gp47/JayE